MNKRKYIKKEELSINYDGQLPPQALEVEEIILGSILLESSGIDNLMAEFNSNLFYKYSNRKIAESMIELYLSHQPIDLITVTNQLRKNGHLEEIGGAYYISSLTNKIAGAANYEFHLRILQQEALKRNIINLCSVSIKKSFDQTEDVFDVLQELQVSLDSSLKEIIKYEIKQVGEIHKSIIKESYDVAYKGIRSGIPSGLKMLDNVTNGWQKSDLIILAGRPSMGKTAAAISMAMWPALEKKMPIAVFSLEMSNQQLVSRMQSALSEINVSSIVKKQLTTSQIHRIEESCISLKTAPIFIDDTPNISLLELKGKARKLVKENKIELIIIDYLQLMRSGLNLQNREQEIAEISKGLKGLSKELNIPIIALSQLSRIVESRQDKKPMLSDLRESGQIEQDADMVLFCYRPEYYSIDTYEIGNESFDTDGLFMLIIAKHRNGELGEIPLQFIGSQTKLTNHKRFLEDIKENNFTFVQNNQNEKNEHINNNNLKQNNDFLKENHADNQEDIPF